MQRQAHAAFARDAECLGQSIGVGHDSVDVVEDDSVVDEIEKALPALDDVEYAELVDGRRPARHTLRGTTSWVFEVLERALQLRHEMVVQGAAQHEEAVEVQFVGSLG